jgi:charged multivesicular body protein 4
MKLFFGKGTPKATAKDSIIKLRETLEMLEKREAYLQTKIDNEHKIAKTNATKNKRGIALFLYDEVACVNPSCSCSNGAEKKETV